VVVKAAVQAPRQWRGATAPHRSAHPGTGRQLVQPQQQQSQPQQQQQQQQQQQPAAAASSSSSSRHQQQQQAQRWTLPSLLTGLQSHTLLGVAAAAGLGVFGSGFEVDGPGSVLQALLVLASIIAVHEWGHFTAARLQGIHVTQFAIGFGPPLVSFKVRVARGVGAQPACACAGLLMPACDRCRGPATRFARTHARTRQMPRVRS
jgi:hypothetical protein